MCTQALVQVVLADDHPLFLRGINDLVSASPEIAIVGETTSGLKALQLITELQPDVAVLDVSMPDMSGLLVAEQLLAERCPSRLVFLSANEDPSFVRRALSLGVGGYLFKRSAGEHLINAVRAASEGGLYIDPSIAKRVVPPYKLMATPQAGRKCPRDLTDREQEVMKLVAFGFSNKEVAAKIGVTAKSVETYRSRASEKLELRTRARIVQYALLQGWFGELRS